MESVALYTQRYSLELQVWTSKIEGVGQTVERMTFESRARVFPYLEHTRERLSVARNSLQTLLAGGAEIDWHEMRREAEAARHDLRCAFDDTLAMVGAVGRTH